jgi:hypothetical protein
MCSTYSAPSADGRRYCYAHKPDDAVYEWSKSGEFREAGVARAEPPKLVIRGQDGQPVPELDESEVGLLLITRADVAAHFGVPPTVGPHLLRPPRIYSKAAVRRGGRLVGLLALSEVEREIAAWRQRGARCKAA